MKKYCVICAKEYNGRTESRLPEYAGTCTACRKLLLEEAPSVPLYGIGTASVEALIEELYERIPALFSGPECPLEFSHSNGCSCTYAAGCLALKSSRKIKRTIKNDTKILDDP